MRTRSRFALVAHDGRKDDLLQWARWNHELLSRVQLFATKRTGELVSEATGLRVSLLQSGEMGGDAQISAMIVKGELDVLVFFWDPLAIQPHAADVRSLIRLAVLHDVALACNRRSADLLVTSPLLLDTHPLGAIA